MSQSNIEFKDKIVLFAWIIGLLLIISTFLLLTQSAQSKYLMRTINNVFASRNISPRISDSIAHNTSQTNLMGYWYNLSNSQDKLFVFTVFQDGILIPLGAVISPAGIVKEIMPLSAHAEQVFEKLPQSILEMYIRRIETEGAR